MKELYLGNRKHTHARTHITKQEWGILRYKTTKQKGQELQREGPGTKPRESNQVWWHTSSIPALMVSGRSQRSAFHPCDVLQEKKPRHFQMWPIRIIWDILTAALLQGYPCDYDKLGTESKEADVFIQRPHEFVTLPLLGEGRRPFEHYWEHEQKW